MHVRWEWSCEVTLHGWWREPHLTCMQGRNGHARYESPSEILHSLIFSILAQTLSVRGFAVQFLLKPAPVSLYVV